MEWTDRQKKAIEERNKTLLVAAAAGSGKTAVLVERIKRLILEEKVSIEEMLIVTFTNAAASEMKGKITKAITEELEKGETKNSFFLRQQLNNIYKANISTFHSFALEVIRRYFYVLPIEPNFKICDEGESVLLKSEAMEETFEEYFLSNDPRFIDFLNKYAAGKSEKSVKTMMNKALTNLMSIPEPFSWLTEKVENLKMSQEDFLKGPLGEEIFSFLRIHFMLASQSFAKVLQLAEESGIPEIILKAKEDFEMIQGLESKLAYGSTMEVLNLASQVAYQRFAVKKENKEAYEEIKPMMEKIRNRGKGYISTVRSFEGSRTMSEHVEDIHKTYENMLIFQKLVLDFYRNFQEKKKEKNLLDFSDIEHFALEILKNNQVAEEYKNKFQTIFIDEYQDSNLLQESLISKISRGDNVFMVGDVKQSIYKFRLAEPEIFMDKYRRFKKNKASQEEVIDLNQNFRSKGNVIQAVNHVFSDVMEGYDREAALYQGVSYQGEMDYPVELHLIDQSAQEREDLEEEIQELKMAELEAYVTADIIRQQLGKPIYDFRNSRERKIEKKDIVILMRATRNVADKFQKILFQENIPAHVEDGDGYFDTIEIGIMMNLLRLIDNKRQDIPLITILHSPIFGYTVNELAEIRLYEKKGSFFNAFSQYPLQGENLQLKGKTQETMRRIEDWQELCRYMPLDEFVWKLMKDTGYYNYAGALPGGSQRQANLRLLVDRCIQFQKGSLKGLYSFITYIDAIQDKSVRTGQISLVSENDDVVRIMTIHKSKGLEFPVVIVAGLGKRFNFSNDTSHLDIHKDLGISLSYVGPDRTYFRKTLIQNIIRNKNRRSDMEEEIRILYVAFTRAMDKLILLGTVADMEKAKEKADSMEKGDFVSGSCYLDVIMPTLLDAPIQTILHTRDEITPLASDSNPGKEIVEKVMKKEETRVELKKEEESLKKEIYHRLDYVYPYPEAVLLKTKLSVTELNQGGESWKRHSGSAMPLASPRFEKGSTEFSSAEKGTLVHDFMMRVDFVESIKELERGRENLEKYLKRLLQESIKKRVYTEEEAETIDLGRIMGFFQSPMGRRAAKSDEIQKEAPFSILQRIKGEEVLVQGIIDCYFREGDQYVLLDYKTNYIKNIEDLGEIEGIKSLYRHQLELYKEALEISKGRKVKETCLYLFGADIGITI